MKVHKDVAEAQAPRVAEGALGGSATGAAEEFARRLGSKRREAGAPVRNLFVSNDRDGVKPPMARLLSAADTGGGGRGGHLRLKLYLSLLWVCAAAPHQAIRPARAWAGLLGLDDPETRGARRVQEAMRDLQSRGMVRIEDRGGHASAVTLLSDFGHGKQYFSPSETYNKFKMDGRSALELEMHRYFRVPSMVWTSGLISRLSGPGLAMLLVLRCEQRGKDGTPVWFSPDRALARFALAESTRRLGLEQLRAEGLVTTETRKLSESGDFIDVYRRRKVHTLTLSPKPESPDPHSLLG